VDIHDEQHAGGGGGGGAGGAGGTGGFGGGGTFGIYTTKKDVGSDYNQILLTPGSGE